MKTLKKEKILGVGITVEDEDTILKYIVDSVTKTAEKYYVVTPNPEILVYANSHKSFATILNQARIALCDGVGLVLAGKILQKSLKNRVPGADFMENLCKKVAEKPVTVGFLGAGPKIAELAAECLLATYPGLNVGFVGEEWSEAGFSHPLTVYSLQSTARKVKKQRAVDGRQKSVDILFVAYGFPKQEEWMATHLSKLPVKVMVAVGGSFDYISGKVPRAPKVLRSLGLEWLFRLLVQPWRIRRQTKLVLFIWLVLKEWFLGVIPASEPESRNQKETRS